jgi:hypothetical protein
MQTKIRQEERGLLQDERGRFEEQNKGIIHELDIKQEIINKKKEKLENVEHELEKMKAEKEKLENRITGIAEKAASIISCMFCVGSIILAITVSAFQFFPNVLNRDGLLNYVVISITVLITSANLVTGVNFMGLGQRMKAWLRTKIAGFLR